MPLLAKNKDDFELLVIPLLKNSSCSLIFKEKYLLKSIIVFLYNLFKIMIEKERKFSLILSFTDGTMPMLCQNVSSSFLLHRYQVRM